MLLRKPSQALEMPKYELLSSPGMQCQQNLLLMLPRLQSWEPRTPNSFKQAVKRGQKTLNHCAVFALTNKLQALRRAQPCVLPLREVSSLFSAGA